MWYSKLCWWNLEMRKWNVNHPFILVTNAFEHRPDFSFVYCHPLWKCRVALMVSNLKSGICEQSSNSSLIYAHFVSNVFDKGMNPLLLNQIRNFSLLLVLWSKLIYIILKEYMYYQVTSIAPKYLKLPGMVPRWCTFFITVHRLYCYFSHFLHKLNISNDNRIIWWLCTEFLG